MPLETDAEIRALLERIRTVAVVGASDSPDRPSYDVMKAMQDHGYRVLPVNPRITGERVHGEYIWASLDQIGEPIDMVDVFRRSEDVGDVVEAAIAAGAKAVWMQQGVVNAAAAKRAEDAGLQVVMDRCPKIELRRLGVTPVTP
jgi:hypothetical protein